MIARDNSSASLADGMVEAATWWNDLLPSGSFQTGPIIHIFFTGIFSQHLQHGIFFFSMRTDFPKENYKSHKKSWTTD